MKMYNFQKLFFWLVMAYWLELINKHVDINPDLFFTKLAYDLLYTLCTGLVSSQLTKTVIKLIKAHHQKKKEATVKNNLELHGDYGLRHLFSAAAAAASTATADMDMDCGLRHLFAANPHDGLDVTPSLNHFYGKKNELVDEILDPNYMQKLFRKPIGKKMKRLLRLFHKTE